MAVIRKSITFTEQQNAYVQTLIEEGFYTNDSEYVRDIILKDQELGKRIVDLKEALIDGIESGPFDATFDSIWEKAINEHNTQY